MITFNGLLRNEMITFNKLLRKFYRNYPEEIELLLEKNYLSNIKGLADDLMLIGFIKGYYMGLRSGIKKEFFKCINEIKIKEK